MGDDSKQSWLGEATFRKLALLISQLWIIVSVSAQIMVLIVWVMIFIQNIDVFNNQMGTYMGKDKTYYDDIDGNPGSGYVAGTNMPKQLGGAIFSGVFATAMWIFILISLSADISWRYPIVQRFLLAFHTTGLWDDRKLDEINYFFLWGNALFKLFIVSATGSTSWYGLVPANSEVDTPTFAMYATFILLCSVPLTYVANHTCIHALKRGEWPSIFEARKKDIEATAGGAAVSTYKKEQEAVAAKNKEKERERAKAAQAAAAKKKKEEGS